MKVVIGTRGSRLALWQAEHISDLLAGAGMSPEIQIIETKGDKILDRSLSKIGSKGVFTQELEEALRDGSIDIAVHSAKDLQSQLDEDLNIIAFTERETVNDVLVSKKDIDINAPIVVGTSSTRRVAFLKHYYPHFNIVDLRGNLQTRMRKHEEGTCDAMMLAYAGVHRMDMGEFIVHQFPKDQIVPPVGQGSVAIEVCTPKIDPKKSEAIRAACNNTLAETCLLAERAFLKTVNGGCSIPVFCHVTPGEDIMQITAGIISLDGKEKIDFTETFSPDRNVEKGTAIAEKLLASGGSEILESIKRNL